ncbi:MAG TPA: DUF881 domain-containing protein [bacterium]|nr:DUF881 domain-containing protein [bacterium]
MWQRVGVTALLFLAGFLLILQLRANQVLRAGVELPSHRLADLAVLIRRQQDLDRSLRDEIAALEAKQQQIQTAEAEGRSITGAMQHELAGYRGALGLTPVKGPGITVTLGADARRLSVPQAQDVAGVVNELWAAGAEAVSVNGVRVLATDGVGALPRGVTIAGRVTQDPYAISAIGDPVALEGALMVPGGAVDGLRGVGMTVTLARAATIGLPASSRNRVFHVARPASGP